MKISSILKGSKLKTKPQRQAKGCWGNRITQLEWRTGKAKGSSRACREKVVRSHITEGVTTVWVVKRGKAGATSNGSRGRG